MGMLKTYIKEVKQLMKDFINSLSENDKRCQAAVEAQKLGCARITYISKLVQYFAQVELPSCPAKCLIV
jgi:hypothetical protein